MADEAAPEPLERPPPQDAPPLTPAAPPPAPGPPPAAWLTDQAQRNPYSPAAQAPYTGPSASDTVKAWANWRLGQVPQLPPWNPLTEAMPEPMKEQIVSGGPMGVSAPGAVAGILRSPLTKTQVKYTHPVTGDEPTLVHHGTPHTFPKFSMKYADEGALKGPGIYFTEQPKIASGYAKEAVETNQFFYTEDKARAFAKTVAGDVRRIAPNLGSTGRDGWLVDYHSAPQVRPAFLDIRKPFDADATTIEADQLMLAAEKRVQQLIAAGKKGSASELLDAQHTAYLIKDHVFQAEPRWGRPAADADLGWNELEDMIGAGETNKLLRSMGYDGITHIGGSRTGNAPHRVWIVFDPKQIINPFQYRAKNPAPAPLAPPTPVPRRATQ